MPSGLIELPSDVLLRFGNLLDLKDLLNFLRTCSIVRGIQHEKTLWVDVLSRLRLVEMHPPPLAAKVDPPARCLWLNFETLHYGLIEIVCIPGTHLVVAYTTGKISYWDILAEICMATLEVPGLNMRSSWPGNEWYPLAGSWICGSGDAQLPWNLVAIRVDYSDRAHISITHVVSPAIHNIHFPFHGLFIDPRCLGWCSSSDVVLWSMDANSSVKIQSQAESFFIGEFGLPLTLSYRLFGDRLYLMSHGTTRCDGTVRTFLFPSTFGNHSNAPRPVYVHITEEKATLKVPYSFASSQTEFRGLGITSVGIQASHTPPPDYGVFSISVNVFEWKGRRRWFVHFWPAHSDDDKLYFEEPYFYKHDDPLQLVVGASGTYALVVVPDIEGRTCGYLGLLHFSAGQTPHVTFRKLDIGTLSVAQWRQFALDDSLGLVLATDEAGRMTTISYA
ncbi:hypothetical protein DFH07DRAFT_763607 [Mycena maculata]|uniref:F-box domain-containing protein n=1 Tax=Mycena maculata TaxID=230809 RepID=A0AAD7KG82_9AGAR|nr:hypothetical protein DFH07DRAFT_763607 [Mycena maculata]